MATQEETPRLSSAEEQAPFWEIVSVGQSVLLAYHSCDGSERKRVTRHDREEGAFVCTECGERHADLIRDEPAPPDEVVYPWGRTRG